MLFDSTSSLLHTLITGALTYAALVILLRISGKRTLAKWNAFDFVVTVAFGSILASALTSRDVSFAQAALAVGVLILLQYAVTWLSVRSRHLEKVIKSRPTLLVLHGELRTQAMRRERVSEAEVWAALRGAGIADAARVEALVLETDGSFTVVSGLEESRASTLRDVEGYPMA